MHIPPLIRWSRAGPVAALMVGAVLAAQAQSVAMSGSMGSKALLVIDGAAPKAVSVGQTHRGVKVISVTADQTVVEASGKRLLVHLGGSPISAGRAAAAGGGSQISLTAGSGGHFITPGTINGHAVEFLVDTGATSIAMSMSDAKRMGIDYEKGRPIVGSTATARVNGYQVRLQKVRIQDVEVYDVEAAVLPGSMSHLLLGNSFLTRFQMKRDNDQLTLTKRF
jgi:aspartyl protease family protein